ncbi:MAG: DUF835 domain-containing protein [Thermoplasmatales archaeon]|nr:DUF835 domain-containing protein [Thermoplasmatales archaeon]
MYELNPYAMISLIAILSNLYLGGYILSLNIKERANRGFSMMMLLFALFAFGSFALLTSTDEEAMLFWYKIAVLAMVFVPAAFVHFALVFPIESSSVFARGKHVFALYIPSFIFAGLLNTELFIQKIYRDHWGFYSRIGLAFYFYVVYVALFIAYGFYVLVRSYNETAGLRRKQAKWAVIGAVVVVIVSLTSDVIPLSWKVIYVPPMTSWSVTIMAALVAYSIVRYKLFIVEPSAEELVTTSQKYLLEKGRSYLVKEEKLDKTYEIFYDQVTHGSSGLSITKLPPEMVRERYRIAKTPVVWLTFKDAENAVSPKDAKRIKSAVSDFVGKTKEPVILLDSLDQLMLANGFEKSMSMLREIKDLCIKNNANLLVSVNPEIFKGREMAVIEEDLEEVK